MSDDAALKRKLVAMLAEESSGEEEVDSSDEDAEEEGSALPEFEGTTSNRPAGGSGCDLCFRSFERALTLPETELASLRRDARVVFALGSSNWCSADAVPQCTLERLALSVFEARTAGIEFDRSRSGAEWWTQVRTEGHAQEGIEFHWDVDEYCCDTYGVNVQPQLSTVLYLTDTGAPTIVLQVPGPRSSAEVEQHAYGAVHEGFLSCPAAGKLISFDGQLLHGTVPLAMLNRPDGARPSEPASQPNSQPANQPLSGAPCATESQRVTLLVNVWLGHRPSGIEALPSSLATSLSQRYARPPAQGVRAARCGNRARRCCLCYLL